MNHSLAVAFTAGSIAMMAGGARLDARLVPPADLSPNDLAAEIESMGATDHVWREIQWETCLLRGVAASREENKPVLFWVFLHNPNTERC